MSPPVSTSDLLLSLGRQQPALGSEKQRDAGPSEAGQPEYWFQGNPGSSTQVIPLRHHRETRDTCSLEPQQPEAWK